MGFWPLVVLLLIKFNKSSLIIQLKYKSSQPVKKFKKIQKLLAKHQKQKKSKKWNTMRNNNILVLNIFYINNIKLIL